MDLSSVPVFGRPAAIDRDLSPTAQVPPQATSAPPETPRPVEAAEPPTLPAPIKGLGIAPLEMSQVGDNDDVPVPPEAPAEPSSAAAPADTAPPPDTAEEPVEPDPAAAPPEAPESLPQLLKDVSEGPVSPTVDVRR